MFSFGDGIRIDNALLEYLPDVRLFKISPERFNDCGAPSAARRHAPPLPSSPLRVPHGVVAATTIAIVASCPIRQQRQPVFTSDEGVIPTVAIG